MGDTPQIVGKKLRAIRRRKLVSMGDVAKNAGLSYALIQKMETQNYTPKFENIRTVAGVLGVDPYEFVDFKVLAFSVA